MRLPDRSDRIWEARLEIAETDDAGPRRACEVVEG
jgi:hypothetical protein